MGDGGLGGPIIAPAPTPHGAAEDANQHLPGGAGSADVSGAGASTELGGVPESVGGGRTRPWSDGKRATEGLQCVDEILVRLSTITLPCLTPPAKQ